LHSGIGLSKKDAAFCLRVLPNFGMLSHSLPLLSMMPKMIHQCYSLNYLQYVTVNMQRKPRVGKSGAVGVSTQVLRTLHDFIYLLCHLCHTPLCFSSILFPGNLGLYLIKLSLKHQKQLLLLLDVL